MDDEYKWAGVEDPKIMVTTSRDPSSRLKMFAKVRLTKLSHSSSVLMCAFSSHVFQRMQPRECHSGNSDNCTMLDYQTVIESCKCYVGMGIFHN